MKLLAEQFTKKKWDHTQISREGDIAIYERRKFDVPEPHWEVIKICHHNGFKLKDAEGKEVFIPPAETYPSSEQWGAKGFTYNDKDKAFEKFRELVNEVR